MPKLKTNRSAKKRFRVTGTGKIKRTRAYASHILTKKTSKRKRTLRRATVVAKADAHRVRRMLGH
jgi:large subunit ribosomal protein L35